jgi:hypothetical protein
MLLPEINSGYRTIVNAIPIKIMIEAITLSVM